MGSPLARIEQFPRSIQARKNTTTRRKETEEVMKQQIIGTLSAIVIAVSAVAVLIGFACSVVATLLGTETL
jgi:hypothetical protein